MRIKNTKQKQNKKIYIYARAYHEKFPNFSTNRKKRRNKLVVIFLINYILLFVINVMCINSGFHVCLIICYCYY